MLRVDRLTVGQLATNCYFVSEQKKCLIIDPGGDTDYIIDKIRDFDFEVIGIVATHGHFDHIEAAAELRLDYKAPFLMHKNDEIMLAHYRSSAIHFTKVDPGPAPKIDKYIKEGDRIKIGNSEFRVLETPGHTPGGVCLYNQKQKILFVGDIIFAEGEVGRSDFSYSNTAELRKSIMKLIKLPKDCVVYPGHGKETTVNKMRYQWARPLLI